MFIYYSCYVLFRIFFDLTLIINITYYPLLLVIWILNYICQPAKIAKIYVYKKNIFLPQNNIFSLRNVYNLPNYPPVLFPTPPTPVSWQNYPRRTRLIILSFFFYLKSAINHGSRFVSFRFLGWRIFRDLFPGATSG